MSTSQIHPRSLRRGGKHVRPGLTLIELVVVLTILVALSSLIVPLFGSMLARTHMAKCSTTIPEVAKLIQTQYAATLRLPSRGDSLLNATGTALFADLPANAAGPLGGNLAVAALSAEDAQALIAVGVRQTVDQNPAYVSGMNDATLDSFPKIDPTTARAIAAGGNVAVYDTDAAEALFFLDPAGTGGSVADLYVVFGLGTNSSLVGIGRATAISEAPTHFGDSAASNPRDVYQRYALVYRVSGDAGDRTAEFIGAAAIHSGGLENAEAHRREFWELSRGG